MASIEEIRQHCLAKFGEKVSNTALQNGEITLDAAREHLLEICAGLRTEPELGFEQLIDVCGVDYSEYNQDPPAPWGGDRYAVVYHLLSVTNNHRLRLRVAVAEEDPVVPSVIDIWAVADWFERETFDLFGIIFEGHPDLRRILTDYGFIGHPFRKDFPLIGRVETRYDPDKGRVVYQPVSIQPRVLVPSVVREEGFGDRNP